MAKATVRKRRLHETNHPILLEVNIRILLNELSRSAGKRVTLGQIPDSILDEWSRLGVDAVWPMGVWTTGPLGRDIARRHPGLREEYKKVLPDCTDEDIAGSPYAVQRYTVPRTLGGAEGLRVLRRRCAKRGIGLVLDFVGNHTARDHAWVKKHPEYYVGGSAGLEEQKPDFFFKVKVGSSDRVLAYGRDPMIAAWTDTAQLNHLSSRARRAIISELTKIAALCDGVRCDMAMLLLRDVFTMTWGEWLKENPTDAGEREFWEEAIQAVQVGYPRFLFLAEVYWNLEWRLQNLGFSYTYDKVLYDRLLREGADSVREHLHADVAYQRKSIRFMENHDELRAAKAFASEGVQAAAAVVVATVPGMVLLHDGQLEGRTVKTPVQLVRRPDEPVSESARGFYEKLLSCVTSSVMREGEWRLLSPRAAWHDNPTWHDFLIFWWEHPSRGYRLVVVNYAPHSGQCYAELPVDHIECGALEFRDLMGEAVYVRDRAGLMSKGMYFDLQGYRFHVFEVKKAR